MTSHVLELLSKIYPRRAIRLTHQFLDGREGRPCGIVPPDWNGESVTIEGEWWNEKRKE